MSLNHQGQVLHNGQCMFSYYSIAVTMYGRIEISGRYSTSSKGELLGALSASTGVSQGYETFAT